MAKGCCEIAAMFDQVCLDCNPEPRAPRVKNPCARTRHWTNPYERWESFDGSWKWFVLKKWQVDDDAPSARWFCKVFSPFVPEGESGDVYVAEIKANARRVK